MNILPHRLGEVWFLLTQQSLVADKAEQQVTVDPEGTLVLLLIFPLMSHTSPHPLSSSSAIPFSCSWAHHASQDELPKLASSSLL